MLRAANLFWALIPESVVTLLGIGIRVFKAQNGLAILSFGIALLELAAAIMLRCSLPSEWLVVVRPKGMCC